MYNNSIFWFRQDLRTRDNLGLIKAIESSKNLLCIFIIDKNIAWGFWWLKDKKFLFLKEALLNLDNELRSLWWRLVVFYDYPLDVIKTLSKKYSIDSIFTNKSYSIYGKKRDSEVDSFCLGENIDFFSENDFLLMEPEEVETRKVFTPYFKLWEKILDSKDISIKNPQKFKNISFDFDIIYFLDSIISWEKHPYFTIDFWKKRLIDFDYFNYSDFRNFLDKDASSRLSVYIRFGIFSIREVYLNAKDASLDFVKELAWRDFWQHIDYNFPYTKKYEFQEKKRWIKRSTDKSLFEKWSRGETGYPIVDASIKQLLETNWMHGRARMIVASFLTKDLLIDWRLGESFFKKHLLDYDENVNFGNWQWSASVWADPKPLRIFNPVLQSEKFDKNAKFIKKYIKNLDSQDLSSIHNPIKNHLDYIDLIVDHNEAQKKTKEVYKNSYLS